MPRLETRTSESQSVPLRFGEFRLGSGLHIYQTISAAYYTQDIAVPFFHIPNNAVPFRRI